MQHSQRLPTSANKLLIVARTARSLAQAARAAGYEPWVIDLFGDEDTRAVARHTIALTPNALFDFNPGELFGAIAAVQTLAGPMAIVCGSAFERSCAVLAKMARHYRVLGCSAETYRQLHDLPALFDELRAEYGVTVPATTWCSPRDPQGWLRKSVGGSGGYHVQPAATHPRPNKRHYFQRQVAGDSRSALFIANGQDCQLVGCAAHLRWHGAASYRYEGARTCASPLAALRARLCDIGTILTRRLALRGCFGFDFLWQGEDRVVLVDINPRPPATLDLWPERARLFAAHVAACDVGTLLYSRPQTTIRYAHLILYADAPCRVAADIRWPPWVFDRPCSGTVIARATPVCTLTAHGRTRCDLDDELTRRYGHLRQVLSPSMQRALPATLNIRTMGS